MSLRPGIVLIAGLSGAGKSSFADLLAARLAATHVPLDKYFISVPSDTTFLEWVQSPRAIDWKLLNAHLTVLLSGRKCYSPAFDAWGSGLRVSEGGDKAHPLSRIMNPNKELFAVPGCLSFEFSASDFDTLKLFVDTPLQVIASRHAGCDVSPDQIDHILNKHLTNKYPDLLQYRDQADLVIRGDASEETRLEYCDLVAQKLTCR